MEVVPLGHVRAIRELHYVPDLISGHAPSADTAHGADAGTAHGPVSTSRRQLPATDRLTGSFSEEGFIEHVGISWSSWRVSTQRQMPQGPTPVRVNLGARRKAARLYRILASRAPRSASRQRPPPTRSCRWSFRLTTGSPTRPAHGSHRPTVHDGWRQERARPRSASWPAWRHRHPNVGSVRRAIERESP